MELAKLEHYSNNWLINWKNETQPVKRPGLKHIKWKELCDKWGPYVSPNKCLMVKPYHEDPAAPRRMKVRENAKEAENARKSRSDLENVLKTNNAKVVGCDRVWRTSQTCARISSFGCYSIARKQSRDI